jgi:hypothetical protein
MRNGDDAVNASASGELPVVRRRGWFPFSAGSFSEKTFKGEGPGGSLRASPLS